MYTTTSTHSMTSPHGSFPTPFPLASCWVGHFAYSHRTGDTGKTAHFRNPVGTRPGRKPMIYKRLLHAMLIDCYATGLRRLRVVVLYNTGTWSWSYGVTLYRRYYPCHVLGTGLRHQETMGEASGCQQLSWSYIAAYETHNTGNACDEDVE